MISPGDFLTNLAVEVVYDLLKAGVSRLTALARGSPEEQALKRAVLSGQVNYVTGARAVAFGADARDVVVVTGDNDIVQVFKGPDADTIRQVFRQVLAEIESDRHARALKEYFAALREYCRNLPYLTLYDIRPPKKLDEVYVPLQLRERGPEHEPGSKGDERQRFPASTPDTLSIAEVLQQARKSHLLILGEPGAGKSTLLRRLAEQAWDNPQAIGLERPYLPMLVPLRTLASKSGSLEKRLATALGDRDTSFPLGEELPEGFFRVWAQQMDAPWLLLLDGLDEVPEDRRTGLLQWLDGILPLVGEGRVIITARPSVYNSKEWEYKPFSAYNIQPFTPEQARALAEKWFGDEAFAFLHALEKVRAAALSGTPLLLTIAAKVYLRRKEETGVGSLPERRSQLYDEFINTLLKEAEARGLRAELGGDVADVAKPALARLALAMTEDLALTDEDGLAQVVAEYLREELQLGKDHARTAGRRFIQVMGRRSGVFLQRGGTHEWLHSSFRGYLAAWRIVRDCNAELECVWQGGIVRWKEDRWHEAALFMVSILSNGGKNVSAIIARIWDEGTEGLYFVGLALSEHALLNPEYEEKIIDRLVVRASEMNTFDALLIPNALSILGHLCHFMRVPGDILRIAQDRAVNHAVRKQAILVLENAGLRKELSSLAQDKTTDIDLRLDAILALERQDWLREASQGWLAIAQNREIHASIRKQAIRILTKRERDKELLALAQDVGAEMETREQAAWALHSLGRVDEAAQAWLSLARSKESDEWVLALAAETLAGLDRQEELLTIVQDKKFLSLADTIITLLRHSKQTNILQILARESEVDEHVRILAAIALAESSGRTEELLLLALNKNLGPIVRLRAARALAEKGYNKEAASIMVTLAQDDRVIDGVRMESIIGLERIGHIMLASRLLLSLAEDERVNAVLREYAAERLAKLGKTSEAERILSIIASDGGVSATVRMRAIEMLDELGHPTRVDWLALACDKNLEGRIKERAAEKLAELGHLEEAVSVLLVLLEDRKIREKVRKRAIETLGKFADTSVLTNLRRLAHARYENEAIRRAAREAIARIRQRMAQSGSERGEE